MIWAVRTGAGLIQVNMFAFLPVSDPFEIYAVFAIALLAGVVKGVVGFALPLILLSGLGSLVSAEIALSAMILPTLLGNVWQALRYGIPAVLQSIRTHRRFILTTCIVLLISAQAVPYVNSNMLLLSLGVVIFSFSAMQLMGWQPRIGNPTPAVQIGVGAITGALGGISSVWGPTTVMYLTALKTEKTEQIRTQGVIYGLGAITLAVAHTGSGILNTDTARFSALLVVPSMLGLVVGFAIQDRINQQVFGRVTMLVLLIAGLNLIRRGLLG